MLKKNYKKTGSVFFLSTTVLPVRSCSSLRGQKGLSEIKKKYKKWRHEVTGQLIKR